MALGAAGLAVVVGAAAAVVAHGAGRQGGTPGLLAGDPPAQPAGAAFTAPPALGSRAAPTALAGVAAAGHTVVAVGSRAGLPSAQPLILVSTDGGHTWRSAVPRAGHGTAPAGAVPVMVAGGYGRWLALGTGASWTSRDGSTWTAGPGITAPGAGDRVLGLARGRGGFVAVGENVDGQRPGHRDSPVLWTSANGRTWQRRSGSRLGLSTGRGRVTALRWVAAHGKVIVVGGEVARTSARHGAAHHGAAHHRAHRAATGTGAAVYLPEVWRSTDGGAHWRRSRLPLGHGAARALSGLAVAGRTFVAIRPGRTATGRTDAVAYVSGSGARWTFARRLTARHGGALVVTALGGGGDGVTLSATAAGRRVEFVSGNGHAWHRVAGLGQSAAWTVTGVTAGPGAEAVLAGRSRAPRTAGGPGAQPFLMLAGAHRSQVGQAVLATGGLAGGSVRALAAAAGERVAVGGADGSPAIWSAPVGGHWSRVGPAMSSGPAAGPGLTSVVHGGAGWLAVGGEDVPATSPAVGTGVAGPGGVTWAADVAGGPGESAAPGPVVMTSADGRTWRRAATGPFTAPGTVLAAAAAGRGGYVVVGSEVSGGRLTAAAWFATGRGGWSWTGGAVATGGPPVAQRMLGVTAGGPGFVAVGADGPAPAVWTSPDGAAWRLTILPVPRGAASAALTRVAVVGGRVVAAGTASVRNTPVAFAAVSADGGHSWRGEVLPGSGTAAGGAPAGKAGGPPAAVVTSLAAVPGGVVAAGYRPGHAGALVWTSRDGLGWRLQRPPVAPARGPGIQRITALGVEGHVLTGAGYTATAAGPRPVFWLARVR